MSKYKKFLRRAREEPVKILTQAIYDSLPGLGIPTLVEMEPRRRSREVQPMAGICDGGIVWVLGMCSLSARTIVCWSYHASWRETGGEVWLGGQAIVIWVGFGGRLFLPLLWSGPPNVRV